jgi:hypothetical protein|tara:strand:+ start:365 stop:613 length:249 start_codon:yes stop_codon:yes gene_type:complete
MSIDYKEEFGRLIIENTVLKNNVMKLERENLRLSVLFSSLRDEFLDMGGDPKQLELFENQQMEIFEDVDIKPIDKVNKDLNL